MENHNLLKKKYSKKKLKEYYSQYRSSVGLHQSTAEVAFSSKRDYNRQKGKQEVRKEIEDE